ncbi:MAG: hypothetical protein ACKVX9_09095 [Blastocatellia bacterium]
MATKKVKNTSNQPLYFNLPGGRSMKVPARSVVEVEEADLTCDEMAFHQSRGNISIADAAIAAERKTEPKPATTTAELRRVHKEDKGGE